MSDDPDPRDLERRRRRQRAEAAPYAVGYAKPDPAHQFKKGNQMGGRPRKPKPGGESHAEMVLRIAVEPIRVTRNGKTMTVNSHEAVWRGIRSDALRGDPRARRLWMAAVEKAGAVVGLASAAQTGVDYDREAAEVRRRLNEMFQALTSDPQAHSGDGSSDTAEVESPDAVRPAHTKGDL